MADLKTKVSCFYWQRLTALVCDVPVIQSLSIFGVNSDATPVQTQPGGLHPVGWDSLVLSAEPSRSQIRYGKSLQFLYLQRQLFNCAHFGQWYKADLMLRWLYKQELHRWKQDIFLFVFPSLNVVQNLRRKWASSDFAGDYLTPISAWPWSSSTHLLSSATESDPPPTDTPTGQGVTGWMRMTGNGWLSGKETPSDTETYLPMDIPLPLRIRSWLILGAYLTFSIQGVSHTGH